MSSIDENKKKNIIKVALFAGLIIFLTALIKTTGLHEYLDKERLHSWIEGFGPWGPLAYIPIYSITPSLLLPGLPVTIVACIAFFVARYFARSQVENLLEGKLKKIDEGVEKKAGYLWR